MALTEEQQERVVQMLMAHPDKRDMILAEAGKISREGESTLERSFALGANAFLRELPLGYGDELGLSGDVGPARNVVEQGAEIVGGVAGAIPSFIGTGMGLGAGLARIPRAVKAVKALSPAARLVGRDVAVSGVTEGIRKPEEGRSRLEMAAKGAMAGAGAAGGFAALSPALTRTGANVASKYGDKMVGRAIRPAAASLGGTAGAATASAVLDDEMRWDEALMEGIGAGVFSAIDMGAIDTGFMDVNVARQFVDIQQEGLRNGNYAGSLSKILELAEQNPGAKKLIGDQVFTSVLESLRPQALQKMVDNNLKGYGVDEGLTENPIAPSKETEEVRALVHVKREEGWEGSPLSGWVNRQVLPSQHLQIPQTATPDPALEGVLPTREQYDIHTYSFSGTGNIAAQGLPGEGRSFSPEQPERATYTDEDIPEQVLTQKANGIMQGILKDRVQIKKDSEYDDWLRLIAEEAAPLMGRDVTWHEDMTTQQLDKMLGSNSLSDLQNPRWDFVYEQALSDVDEGPLDLGGTGATKEKTLGEIVAEEGGIRAEGGDWDQLKDEVKKKRYNWARRGIGKIVYLDGKSGRPLDDIAISIQEAHPGRIKDAEDLRQKLLHTDVLTPVKIAEDNYFSQMEESRKQLAEDSLQPYTTERFDDMEAQARSNAEDFREDHKSVQEMSEGGYPSAFDAPTDADYVPGQTPPGAAASTQKFADIAAAQRDAPEEAMVKLASAGHSNLFGTLLEDGGDLIHRMAEQGARRDGGFAPMNEKVNSLLRKLQHEFPVDREINEQVESAVEYWKSQGRTDKFDTVAAAQADQDQLRAAYVQAHQALTPANEAQRMANQVAISLGNKDFKQAEQLLLTLKGKLDEGRQAWKTFARDADYVPGKPPGAMSSTQLGPGGKEPLGELRKDMRKAMKLEMPTIRRSEGVEGQMSDYDVDAALVEKWNAHNRQDPITKVEDLGADDIGKLSALIYGENRRAYEERSHVRYYNQMRDVLKSVTLPIRSYFDSEGIRLLKSSPVINSTQWGGLIEVASGDFSAQSPVHQQLVADGLITPEGKLTDFGSESMYGTRDFTEEYEVREGDTVRFSGQVEAGIENINGEVNFHPEIYHVIDAENNIVFDADPDIANIDMDGVRQFETDMDGGGKAYQMQPGDKLVQKNPMQTISFKMGLMQYADALVNEKRLAYKDAYNDFIADAKAHGMSEGEAWAMVSDEKLSDIYSPYLDERSERVDSEESPRLSMLDVLHQRDGIKTIDDLDAAIADGRVPAWYRPHIEAFTAVNNVFADAATRANLKIHGHGEPMDFMPRDIYAPMYYDPKRLTDDAWKAKQVAKLVREGVPKKDAEEIVTMSSDFNNPRIRRSGNLERSRDMSPEEGYLINPEIMWGQYSYRNANRILRAQLFGSNDEVAETLLREARVQGASETATHQYFRFAGREGNGSEAVADVLAGLNQFTALTRMTMSYLPQMLQLNNTAAIAGYRNTFRGLMNAMRAASKEQREDIGASFIERLNGLMVSGLDIKPNAKMMKYAPHLRAFAHTDQFIRDVSGLAAVPYMNDIGRALEANPRNAREINKARELGIDPGEMYRAYRDRASNPAAWDKIVNRAGLQLSNKTQFLNRSENLPHFWQSPIGRAVTMFKGFLLMQTRFMRDLVMPAWSSFPKGLQGKNNQGVMPALARLILFPGMAMAGGEVVNDIKAMLGARRRPDEMGERLFQNMMTAGSAGIAIEMMRSMSEGRVQAFEMVMGPSLSGAVRTAADGMGMFGRVAKNVAAGEEVEWDKVVGPTVRNAAGQAVGPAALLAQHMGLSGKMLQVGLMAGAMGQQTAGRILAPPQQKQYQAVPLDEDYANTVLTGKSDQERMDELIKQIRRLSGNSSQMAGYGF